MDIEIPGRADGAGRRVSRLYSISRPIVAALALLAGAGWPAPPALGQIVLRVDDDAPPGGSGLSWPAAFSDLQDALAAAVAAGGGVNEIRIAQGEYKPAGPGGSRSATFQMINGVEIKGGYAGIGAPDPNARDIVAFETVLSGDLDDNDGPNFINRADNSWHVVTGHQTDISAVLDGVGIRGGNANNAEGSNDKGGGFFCDDGSPTLSNLHVTDNRADRRGGGILLIGGSARVSDCTISENGSAAGAGMYFDGGTPQLERCTIMSNSGGDGAGIYSFGSAPTIMDCDFQENTASHHGGGLRGTATIINCRFLGNTADGLGGGMEGGGTLINTIFSGNVALRGGGLSYGDESPVLTNCVFSLNIATADGGGIRSGETGPGTPTIANCVLWANQDASGTGEVAQIQVFGSAFISFNCIQGWTGVWGGEGNIDADPLFLDADGLDNIPGTPDDDLHIGPSSPCVGTGDDGAQALPAFDFEGDPRVQQCRVDMGADETPFFNDDCNTNGVADACDLETGASPDCNGNLIPDECDVASGASADCNVNGVPDECDPDCDNDGHPDDCVPPGAGFVPASLAVAADNCVDASYVVPGILYMGTTVGATPDGESGCASFILPFNDVWYRYRPIRSGELIVSICGSNLLGDVSIHSGCPGVGNNALACTNAAGCAAILAVGANSEYWIRIAPRSLGAPDDSFQMLLTGPPALGSDCDGNGLPDTCDIATGTLTDCNDDALPDECQLAAPVGWSDRCVDAQLVDSGVLYNGTNTPAINDGSASCNNLATWDVWYRYVPETNGTLATSVCGLAGFGPVLSIHPACPGTVTNQLVCSAGPCGGPTLDVLAGATYLVRVSGRTGTRGDFAIELTGPSGFGLDCNGNAIPDDCDIGSGLSDDCNANGVPDECEIAATDCNQTGIPDGCDILLGISQDCNSNGVPDECDVASASSPDCNGNGIPDECDVASGSSPDCNANNIPDECEPDCNQNGVPDDCDIIAGSSRDCNRNGIPDECDVAILDCNGNGVPDDCDVYFATLALTPLPQTVAVGAGPRFVTAADLDGDLLPDLVSANPDSDDVSVALGNGDGTFQAAIEYATGGLTPRVVTTAQLDADSVLDLAVANMDTGNVSVLRGVGDGSFMLPEIYPTASGARDVTATDVDGDNLVDLVVANQSDHTVSVLINDGNGSFLPSVNYRVSGLAPYPRSVIAQDLDGDGDADLAIALNQANRLEIMVNNGDGTFGGQGWYQAGLSPSYVATGDFDSDGDVDVAVSNQGTAEVSLLFNNGDATFAARVPHQVGVTPLVLMAGDLDGNGFPEIVAPNYWSHDISVLVGLGDGSFRSEVRFPAISDPYAVGIADLTGDGKPEIMIANVGPNEISILLNESVVPVSRDCNGNSIPDECDIASGTSRDCNGNGIPDECEGPACPGILAGDMDCSGTVDMADLPDFVESVLAGSFTCNADVNGDLAVNGLDIPGFVGLLVP